MIQTFVLLTSESAFQLTKARMRKPMQILTKKDRDWVARPNLDVFLSPFSDQMKFFLNVELNIIVFWVRLSFVISDYLLWILFWNCALQSVGIERMFYGNVVKINLMYIITKCQ